MNSVHGFVYGHYDSRGGTYFIAAGSKTEADTYYNKNVFAEDEIFTEKELIEMDYHISDDDFMFEADLYMPYVPPSGTELEEIGIVVEEGNYGLEDWNEEILKTEVPDDFSRKTGFAVLEFVPFGEKPKKLSNGWNQPRWDDDAYGFIFEKITTTKGAIKMNNLSTAIKMLGAECQKRMGKALP